MYHFSTQKRIFDLIVAIFGLILSLPLLIIISILIKLTSRGPILFEQRRSGINNRPFVIYKFRTMKLGADKEQKKLLKLNLSPYPTFKISDDPRYVGIGKLLSNYGLDELPQLINVIKGDMSIVGPRPFPLHENKHLPKFWKFRTLVKPGIFSLAVLLDRKKLDAEKWAKLDYRMFRLENWFEDLKVIIQSILKLIKK